MIKILYKGLRLHPWGELRLPAGRLTPHQTWLVESDSTPADEIASQTWFDIKLLS